MKRMPSAGQPVVDLGHAAFDIRAGPGARPGVFGTELSERQPVRPGELGAVRDAAPALQRRAREPEPAERFLRLAPEVLLEVAVDEDHAAAAVERLDGGGDPGDAGARDRDVRGMAGREAH